MMGNFGAVLDRYTYATLWAAAFGVLLTQLAIPTGIKHVLVAGVFGSIVVETLLIDWLYASPTVG